MRRGNLFVISGPSGAGKGTLVAQLLLRVSDAWVSKSVTTRIPREGEQNGVEYYFADDKEFDRLIAENGLLEWAQVYGKRYGTPRATIEEHIDSGKQVILEIDVQGAFQVKEKMPDAHLVFIEPPSLQILEERLRGRATESEEMVASRMNAAEVELSQKIKYDICIINDRLDDAVEQLVAYVDKCADKEQQALEFTRNKDLK